MLSKFTFSNATKTKLTKPSNRKKTHQSPSTKLPVSAREFARESHLTILAELARVLLGADAALHPADRLEGGVFGESETRHTPGRLQAEVAEEVEAAVRGLDAQGGEVGEQTLEVFLGGRWTPARVLVEFERELVGDVRLDLLVVGVRWRSVAYLCRLGFFYSKK